MMVFAPGHYSKKWGKWFVDEWMWFDHGYPCPATNSEYYHDPRLAVQAFIFG